MVFERMTRSVAVHAQIPLPLQVHQAPAAPSPSPVLQCDRRRLLAAIPSVLSVAGALPFSAFAEEDAPTVTALGTRLVSPLDIRQPKFSSPWDPKMIYYPRWLFGEWRVTSIFKDIRVPLGRKLVPDGFLQAADAPAEEGGIGAKHSYSLRFYSTLPDTFENNTIMNLGGMPHDAIIQDRAFNTKSMTDSFLGYDGAVASVEYDGTEAPLKQKVILSQIGPDMQPLPPRRIELYFNALKSEADGEYVFRTSELARQVFIAPRDVQVSDYEVINEYTLEKNGVISGKQRSLLYLQPQDELYFKAGRKAVVVYDYDFHMERVAVPTDAPQGAIACVETPKDVIQCL